jgi:hypothetical protein
LLLAGAPHATPLNASTSQIAVFQLLAELTGSFLTHNHEDQGYTASRRPGLVLENTHIRGIQTMALRVEQIAHLPG